MSFIKKIKDFIGFDVSDLDLNPELEDEMIENFSTKISKYGMELPALLFGYSFLPMSTLLVQTTLLPLSPVLEAVVLPGFRYVAFFEDKNILKRLLDRIKELQKERESKKRERDYLNGHHPT